MHANDESIEPVTDLELALGYSNQCIEERLNDNSGAGANAVSRADITFVGTNALSELVWSPKKGLSLKCADGSFSNRKPPLLWGARPDNMVSGPSTDKPISKEYFMKHLGASDVRTEVVGRDNSIRFLTSDTCFFTLNEPHHEVKTGNSKFLAANDGRGEEMNAAGRVSFLHKKEDLSNNKEENAHDPINLPVDENKIPSFPDEPKLYVAQKDPTSEEPVVRARDTSDGNHGLQTEIVSDSMKECESYGTKMQKAPSLGREHDESLADLEKERENEVETGCRYFCPLQKLESTSENDLQTPHSENIHDVANNIMGSESSHEVQNSSQQDDQILPKDKTLAGYQFTTNSRIQRYQMKGKAKALSDGNVSERMLNAEDDSHESVESCNTDRFLSAGKKRCSFDPLSCVGSKSFKRKIQESPSSSSFVKNDSSFMNWISNMMTGFLKSNEDEAPALALANPNHGHERCNKNPIPCDRNQDQGSKNMGFQSIFRSLYYSKEKTQETVSLNANHQTEGSKELELDNKICDINATPVACCMVAGNVFNRFLQSNEKLNESTSGRGKTPVAQTKLLSMNTASCQEINRNNSAENNNPCNLATAKEKDGTSSNSSLGKRKRNSAENTDTELPSEGKAADNSKYKSDPLTSFWITRFTPKTLGPLSNQELCIKSTGEALDCSNDSMRLKTQLNHLSSFNDHKIVGSREQDQSADNSAFVQSCATGTEASFSFYKISRHSDEKSIFKMNSILPFSGFGNSEAMASVFARRLDALKHIMPSDSIDKSARGNLTSFFCGIKGHHLRDCSKIIDSELEDFLKHDSFNGAEELPCVCIRCSQSNHWAVVCPNASSRIRNQAECGGASVVNQCSPSKMQLNPRNEDNAKQLGGEDSQLQATDAPKMGKDLNSKWNSHEATASGKMDLNVASFEKDVALRSREKKVKENQILPLCNLVNGQMDAPRQIFDAVKRLRLSRTDILKWTTSRMALSHLDGFFLRLRLVKREKGLAGARYCVASITGVQQESSTQNSKNSIAVNIGGVKCLVESQYISNHDFNEDELMTWWSTTLKAGWKMPSEEDLQLKVEERKLLGF